MIILSFVISISIGVCTIAYAEYSPGDIYDTAYRYEVNNNTSGTYIRCFALTSDHEVFSFETTIYGAHRITMVEENNTYVLKRKAETVVIVPDSYCIGAVNGYCNITMIRRLQSNGTQTCSTPVAGLNGRTWAIDDICGVASAARQITHAGKSKHMLKVT